MHVFWPYLPHLSDFIKINKNWNSNLNYFQQLFVSYFSPFEWWSLFVLVLDATYFILQVDSLSTKNLHFFLQITY